jgi:hypothetical protein
VFEGGSGMLSGMKSLVFLETKKNEGCIFRP